MNNYVLILDEVMEVVSQVNISSYDINLLIHNEQIVIDEFGKVLWNKENYKEEQSIENKGSGQYYGKWKNTIIHINNERRL